MKIANGDGTTVVAVNWTKRIARITDTHLGYEDHGIFTAVVTVDYGGSSQGIGMYGLDRYNEGAKTREGTRYGMEWIIRFMRACGVSQWEKLKGRTVHVLLGADDDGWNGKVVGVEPLPTEGGKRFVFDEIKGLADE